VELVGQVASPAGQLVDDVVGDRDQLDAGLVDVQLLVFEVIHDSSRDGVFRST